MKESKIKQAIKELLEEGDEQDIYTIADYIGAGINIEKISDLILERGDEREEGILGNYYDYRIRDLNLLEEKSDKTQSELQKEILKRDPTFSLWDDILNVEDENSFGYQNFSEIYDQAISSFARSYVELGKEIDELPSIVLMDNDFLSAYLYSAFELRYDHFHSPIYHPEKNASHKKCVDFIERIQSELDKQNAVEGETKKSGITPQDIEAASNGVRAGTAGKVAEQLEVSAKGENTTDEKKGVTQSD